MSAMGACYDKPRPRKAPWMGSAIPSYDVMLPQRGSAPYEVHAPADVVNRVREAKRVRRNSQHPTSAHQRASEQVARPEAAAAAYPRTYTVLGYAVFGLLGFGVIGMAIDPNWLTGLGVPLGFTLWAGLAAALKWHDQRRAL